MALVTNLQGIPDRVPLIAVGEYDGGIVSVEQKPAEGNRQPRIEVSFSITTDCPDKGKRISENFTLVGQQGLENPNSFTSVRFKQLLKSAGLGDRNEVEASDLVGNSVRFTVKHNAYTDKTTNEQREAANIGNFLFAK
jgi:hypothetical protein